MQFLHIAIGSVGELETQTLLAERLYREIDFTKQNGLIEEVSKMLHVMIGRLEQKANRYTLCE